MANLFFKYKVAVLALFLVLGVYQPAGSAMPTKDCERCKYWQAKIDPSITLSEDSSAAGSTPTFEINDEEAAKALEAAECLLKLEGKTNPSKFSATVSLYLSTRFPPPSVEVAALYYVSYIYHKNWRHAQAMVLVDAEGKKNTKKSIKTAYKAYRAWFEKVKEIGLKKARQQNLDPLDGTDVRWY